MYIKTISFIEAKSPGAHIFSKYAIPRLGAVLLSTILREKGYNVKAFIEDVSEPDWSFIENSDLVCISTITSTAIRAYDIGDRLRSKGIPVIMGGAHPSFLPEESLEHSDYVVRGEGDYILPALIKSLESGNPHISSIQGVSYRTKDNPIVNNPSGDLIENLDDIPEPDFSLVHEWKGKNIYPVSTSRGCPFNCRFCSVIQMFGRKYRFKSHETAFNAIKYATSVSNATIFFVDDNFTANKKRTKAILKTKIQEGITGKWSAQVRTDVAGDHELLKLMADSNGDTVHIGFESINPKTLEAYNKKQGLNEIIKCIKTVKDHGLNIHGMFVLGADTDDVDTIKKTTDFAIKHGIDTVQFMMLTPLPGTPFFFDMKDADRLIHTDWSKYDAHHAVFKPLLMKPQTLHIETLKAMAKFYSWKYIIKHISKFEFFYAAAGLYGKNAVKRALEEAKDYLESIGIPLIEAEQYG